MSITNTASVAPFRHRTEGRRLLPQRCPCGLSVGRDRAGGRAESFAADGSPGRPFDLLVNDMNLDPEASAALMVGMAQHLKPGAFAIMTIKLVIRNPTKLLATVIPFLEARYEVVRIRSLFHNRQEITALLHRRR